MYKGYICTPLTNIKICLQCFLNANTYRVFLNYMLPLLEHFLCTKTNNYCKQESFNASVMTHFILEGEE